MKALTLYPSFANDIHNLKKNVEYRTWKIPLQIWFLLHSGKGLYSVKDQKLICSAILGKFRVWKHQDCGNKIIGHHLEYIPLYKPIHCDGKPGLWEVPENWLPKDIDRIYEQPF